MRGPYAPQCHVLVHQHFPGLQSLHRVFKYSCHTPHAIIAVSLLLMSMSFSTSSFSSSFHAFPLKASMAPQTLGSVYIFPTSFVPVTSTIYLALSVMQHYELAYILFLILPPSVEYKPCEGRNFSVCSLLGLKHLEELLIQWRCSIHFCWKNE